jgi:hypothetical protein
LPPLFLAKLNASGIRKAPQPLVFSRNPLSSISRAPRQKTAAMPTSLPDNCPKFASWIAV